MATARNRNVVDLDPLLTPQQVAQYRHVSVGTLAQERYLGKGPRYIKAGRRVFYRTSDLRAWLDAHTCDPTDGAA